MEMVKIQGVVERITYQNPENGYSVIRVAADGYDELVTVVGNLIDVNVGSVLCIEGEWKNDRKHGVQFYAQKWRETIPATVFGIEKYLGSGLIKGVGKAFAKRIVDKFGLDTISVIEDKPERLFEIEGIGKKRVEMITKSWEQQKEIKNIMIFLQSYEISSAFAVKIYKRYGNNSIDVVKENPYTLADDIWGIGFKTADNLAMRLGFEKDCFLRCRSGILYTMNQLANEGHVYALKNQLIEKSVELLDINQKNIEESLEKILMTSDLIVDSDSIYLPAFYNSEVSVARKLNLLNNELYLFNVDYSVDIEKIQNKLNIQYDEIQSLAIRTAVSSKIMVLTGGPGTGKTTVTLGIIEALRSMGLEILLAAPTGRAAKRMSETTGMEAKTIHRLLAYSPTEGYQHNENNHISGDVLIVDECSMIDIILMNSLLKAIPSYMKVIFIGDTDQLPSVGAGNVLRDIIDSCCFPVVRLTKIFRQAQSSRIIMNAHRVNRSEFPNINNGRNSDFFFIEEEEPEKIAERIVELVKKRLPKYCNVSPYEIQVLTPMQKGIVGCSNLNAALQREINPKDRGLIRGGRVFHEDDKIMQIKNNYEKEVFNGDIGVVSSIDFENNKLFANFENRIIEYDATELDELVQAYAITIHKSQGSEYPVVVMPITMSHFIMLQKNLIYTGITRAKKLFVFVGTKKAISYAIRNVTVTKRNTKLRERLQNY